MLEPPAIAAEEIIATVEANYRIAVAALTFLPIGNDAASFVYRLEAADGAPFFLKLRTGAANEPSFAVPRYLADHGVGRVAAALRTVAGALWVDLADFALALYPYIDGVTGTDAGMTEHHWVTFGATLRQIHETVLPPEIAGRVRRDEITPESLGVIERLDAHILSHTFTDPSERELAAYWSGRRLAIRALAERAGDLARQVRATAPAFVLCHADIHTWNILIDTADQLWIIDWDETVLAPRERDLMFVRGGIGAGLVGAREEAWFFEGYGSAVVDPLALAYYRSAWALSDIAAYGEQVFFMPEAGVENKRAAVQGLVSCFQPGNIVEIASQSV